MIEKKITILGVNISETSRVKLMNKITKVIKGKQKLFLVSANSELLHTAYYDKELRAVLNRAYCFPESVGLRLAYPFYEIIPGVEISEKLLKGSAKIYLFGSELEVVSKLANKYKSVVGYCDGYFKKMSEKKMLENINSLRPNIVLIALGGKKQEEWIDLHFDELRVNVFMGVGGSFDVLSGIKSRAPMFFRFNHLEWFYRIVKERRFRRFMKLIGYVFLLLFRRK